MPLTPTTRLALVQIDPNPTTGDFVDPTVINANFAALDAVIGATPATSGARPSSPFNGQLIRESDTSRVLVRNGTANVWDPVSGAYICTSSTRPSVKYDGMIIRETDTKRVYIWNGTQSTWDLLRLEWSRISSSTDGALRTTTSSTFNNAGANNGIAFTAPATGSVNIQWRTEIQSGASSVALCSIEVRTGNVIGSGTVVVAPASNYSIRNDTTSYYSGATFEVVGGLTAFTDYNVRLMHASTNNVATCSFANRRVTVTPDL